MYDLFIKKYQPKKYDDFIIHKNIVKKINNFIYDENIMNLFIYGRNGQENTQ